MRREDSGQRGGRSFLTVTVPSRHRPLITHCLPMSDLHHRASGSTSLLSRFSSEPPRRLSAILRPQCNASFSVPLPLPPRLSSAGAAHAFRLRWRIDRSGQRVEDLSCPEASAGCSGLCESMDDSQADHSTEELRLTDNQRLTVAADHHRVDKGDLFAIANLFSLRQSSVLPGSGFSSVTGQRGLTFPASEIIPREITHNFS